MSSKTDKGTFTMGAMGAEGGRITITPAGRGAITPPDSERRETFIRGARRLRADAAAVKALEEIHHEVLILEEQETTPIPDPVTAAAGLAGKALFKVLGKDAFPAGVDEAVFFARGLPLIEARQQARAVETERLNLGRQRNDARKKFWADAVAVARPVARFSRASMDDDRMVDEVSLQGAE
jgi:hypothetical protein